MAPAGGEQADGEMTHAGHVERSRSRNSVCLGPRTWRSEHQLASGGNWT
jgi:hypothetical protein